jgi:poly(hydroxyalkanoate) granule-associated protein
MKFSRSILDGETPLGTPLFGATLGVGPAEVNEARAPLLQGACGNYLSIGLTQCSKKEFFSENSAKFHQWPRPRGVPMAARSKKSRLATGVAKTRGMAKRPQAASRVRRVLEAAQSSVQTRLGSARDQATETWDNIEALVQHRVQMALHQIGVPSSSEIRLLTRRVEELSRDVKALSARPARPGAKAAARAKRKAAGTRR